MSLLGFPSLSLDLDWCRAVTENSVRLRGEGREVSVEDREKGLTQWGHLDFLTHGNPPAGVLQGSSLKLSLSSFTDTNQANRIVRFLHPLSLYLKYSTSVLIKGTGWHYAINQPISSQFSEPESAAVTTIILEIQLTRDIIKLL